MYHFPSPKWVSNWLFLTLFMIFIMSLVGAITRLTESGLSIMEWAPLSGTIPPLSEQEWQRLFALYQQTGEYRFERPGMDIDEFKTIFWWEWIHRLFGRLIGLVYGLPLIYGLLTRAFPRWMIKHLVICMGLGGLQGGIGWFMVASGFGDLMDVSPIRLSLHLGIALVIYTWLLCVWIALKLGKPIQSYQNTKALMVLIGLLAITLFSGALVAGTNGGFIYNTFPMMGDGWWPKEYNITAWLTDPATTQAHHRLIAITTATLTCLWAWTTYKSATHKQKKAIIGLLGVLGLQVLLGILTLLWVVPIPMAVLHQGVAILLLSKFIYIFQIFIRNI